MNRFEELEAMDESRSGPAPANQAGRFFVPLQSQAMQQTDDLFSGINSNANGAMGGGGFGGAGGGLGEPAAFTQVPVQSGEAHATGMSLKFDLPTVGKAFTYSKVGGEPRLALAIKPVNAWDNFNSALWSAIWVGLSFLIGHAIREGLVGRFTQSEFAYGFVLFGFLWCIILPLNIAFVGVILLLAGVILWWLSRSNRSKPASTEASS